MISSISRDLVPPDLSRQFNRQVIIAGHGHKKTPDAMAGGVGGAAGLLPPPGKAEGISPLSTGCPGGPDDQTQTGFPSRTVARHQ